MKVSKGLEFPVVALPDVGYMPAKGEDEQKAARVFYVAATRATRRLFIGIGCPSATAIGGMGTRETYDVKDISAGTNLNWLHWQTRSHPTVRSHKNA